MFRRCDFTKWLVMGAVLVSSSSLCSKSAWAQDAAARMQETVDAADRRIREIVRELARPGLSPERRAELIREKENQEWARSQAQWALYKEREERRASSPDAIVARARAEWIAWQDAADAWAKEWNNFERQLSLHEEDAREQRQAVADFEGLPPEQQTQQRANQLNEWYRYGMARRDRLMTWHQQLERKRVELWNRHQSLEARVRGGD